MTAKRPLTESKRTLFLQNRQILTPKRDSRESRLALKTTLFSCFSGRACVQHYYSSGPPGRITRQIRLKLCPYQSQDARNITTGDRLSTSRC